MTVNEVKSSLIALDIPQNVWLYETRLWRKIAAVLVQSTYHVYINRDYDYKFNSVTNCLEVAILDTNRTIKKIVDYENIVCFNGVYYYDGGVPHIKNYR